MTDRGSRLCLLDTSAVFTLIEDEPGAERVEQLLRSDEVLLPFIVGLETYYITTQEWSSHEAERRLLLIRQLPARWLDHVTDAVLVAAGRLKAS